MIRFASPLHIHNEKKIGHPNWQFLIVACDSVSHSPGVRCLKHIHHQDVSMTPILAQITTLDIIEDSAPQSLSKS